MRINNILFDLIDADAKQAFVVFVGLNSVGEGGSVDLNFICFISITIIFVLVLLCFILNISYVVYKSLFS